MGNFVGVKCDSCGAIEEMESTNTMPITWSRVFTGINNTRPVLVCSLACGKKWFAAAEKAEKATVTASVMCDKLCTFSEETQEMEHADVCPKGKLFPTNGRIK